MEQRCFCIMVLLFLLNNRILSIQKGRIAMEHPINKMQRINTLVKEKSKVEKISTSTMLRPFLVKINTRTARLTLLQTRQTMRAVSRLFQPIVDAVPLPILRVTCKNYVPVNSKTAHPPRAIPGHLTRVKLRTMGNLT